jgi:hypothetical protein
MTAPDASTLRIKRQIVGPVADFYDACRRMGRPPGLPKKKQNN